MKQKLIAVVLLGTSFCIPAPSKECGRAAQLHVVEAGVTGQLLIPAVKSEEAITLPSSPFSRLLFNL
jgi:hypothetical protein